MNFRTRLQILIVLALPLVLIGWTSNSERRPGSSRQDSHEIVQVWVPAGVFLMGTADTSGLDPPSWARAEIEAEQPQHEVEITQGFWLDKYEVTNSAFDVFVQAGGYADESLWTESGLKWLAAQSTKKLPRKCLDEFPGDHPRVCVTWYEADAYARWRGGRLPTEAEWEYAARGPESLIYPWGDEFDPKLANVVASDGLVPVNHYPDGASWVGAFNLAGNAMEWVQDWLDYDYYQEELREDPQGPAEGKRKVEKGGWWGSNPYVARSAYKHFEDPPYYKDHHIGFRIVTEGVAGQGASER